MPTQPVPRSPRLVPLLRHVTGDLYRPLLDGEEEVEVGWGPVVPAGQRPRHTECLRIDTWRTAWHVNLENKVIGDPARLMRHSLELDARVGKPLVIRWHDGRHGERRWTHGGIVLQIVDVTRSDPFKQ